MSFYEFYNTILIPYCSFTIPSLFLIAPLQYHPYSLLLLWRRDALFGCYQSKNDTYNTALCSRSSNMIFTHCKRIVYTGMEFGLKTYDLTKPFHPSDMHIIIDHKMSAFWLAALPLLLNVYNYNLTFLTLCDIGTCQVIYLLPRQVIKLTDAYEN